MAINNNERTDFGSRVSLSPSRVGSETEEDTYLAGSMLKSIDPGKIVVGEDFWAAFGSDIDKTKKVSFYVTVIDPESGEVVRQTNAFDAFIVSA